jgi:RNA polymerase sigma factor (sigma-70 family)
MRDDPEVIAMVTAARDGDVEAWNKLVERYAPLVWSVCRTYRLSGSDAEDVGQSVWLRLVEQLPKIRVPAALPGWILTTTRRECLRVLRAAQRVASTPASTKRSSRMSATPPCGRHLRSCRPDASTSCRC